MVILRSQERRSAGTSFLTVLIKDTQEDVHSITPAEDVPAERLYNGTRLTMPMAFNARSWANHMRFLRV